MRLNYLVRVLSLLFLFTASTLFSQEKRQLTGNVYDINGEPIVGVSVVIAGTFQGTSTGEKGEFIMTVSRDDILIFSFIGYQEQKIKVGAWKNLKVIMEEDVVVLEETVVTALGIKRSEKALGYSITKVNNEALTNTISNNWLNSLSGKVAGLNFDAAAAGPSGSMRVTLRGESSLNPTKSEALFVVDGVPINSKMISSGGSSKSAYNATSVEMPVDYGAGSSDLNPEDIESVTVLKGASATALYGSRAANGAIIITTKGGKVDKGIGVAFSTFFTWEEAGFWPDFQNEYGAGNRNSILQESLYSYYKVSEEGISASSNHYAYGPRFQGQMFYQYGNIGDDGKYFKSPWVPRDWYKGFYTRGFTNTNSVSIEGNSGKGSSGRVSFSDTRNSWITPNSGYERQVMSISFDSQINRWINLSTKMNYNRKTSDNLPMSGYGRATIPGALLWGSPNVDHNWYRDYKTVLKENDYKRNNAFYNIADSPYLQAFEQLNTMSRDRIYGTVTASIDIVKGLNLLLRTGIDIGVDFRTQRKPWGSRNFLQGQYKETMITNLEINNDFLLKYDNRFKDFGLVAMVGGNIMKQGYNRSSQTAVSLEIPEIYTLANSTSILTTSSYRSDKQINSLYGMLQLSYKDYAFLDITGRNDWSSSLDPRWNSYFYPSISTSILFSSIFNLGKKVELLKLRLSWANVGNDTDAYSIENYYNNSPFGGGVVLPTQFSSATIKPEMTRSWEVGLEGNFLSGRIGFDITLYSAESYNQILNAPVDPSTGFSSALVNAGLITNKGLEISITGQPVYTKKFKWETSLVFSRNVNQVVKLAPGVDTWQIARLNQAQVLAIPGGTLGAIYGTGFARVPNGTVINLPDGTTKDISGEKLFDAITGNPIIDKATMIYLGDTQNKFKSGITNTFSYRGFKLGIQVDGAFGGRAYSNTASMLSMTGKLKNTLEGRYDGLIGDGYNYDAATGNYSKNNTITESVSYYYDQWYARENVEANIYSTTYIKLREVTLEYNLPKKIVNKLKFINGISFSIFGRNLAMWTEWPQFDPEVACLEDSTITTGLEAASFPMTRSYGFNMRIKF